MGRRKLLSGRDRLNALRLLRRGAVQADVARRYGVSRSVISRLASKGSDRQAKTVGRPKEPKGLSKKTTNLLAELRKDLPKVGPAKRGRTKLYDYQTGNVVQTTLAELDKKARIAAKAGDRQTYERIEAARREMLMAIDTGIFIAPRPSNSQIARELQKCWPDRYPVKPDVRRHRSLQRRIALARLS
jgi:hypothetical protein